MVVFIVLVQKLIQFYVMFRMLLVQVNNKIFVENKKKDLLILIVMGTWSEWVNATSCSVRINY